MRLRNRYAFGNDVFHSTGLPLRVWFALQLEVDGEAVLLSLSLLIKSPFLPPTGRFLFFSSSFNSTTFKPSQDELPAAACGDASSDCCATETDDDGPPPPWACFLLYIDTEEVILLPRQFLLVEPDDVVDNF